MVSVYLSSCWLRLQNVKGMIIVILLVLSLSVIQSFLILNHQTLLFTSKNKTYSNGLFGITLFLYPVFGWVADVYWGRYKMIRRSLWILWVSTIAFSLVSVIPHGSSQTILIKEICNIAAFILMSLSLGGLQANILQFGIDQLPDASSDDVIAFSDWYVWLWYVSTVIVVFSQNCVCLQYRVLAKLLLPASLTVAISLDFIFNHWFIKEPASGNPFKLIYKVMYFALKNKHPRQRSAFTYWDDNRFSRIDLAKKKFGGPFTTEEVEDVKTFWRMLVVMGISCIFVGFFVNIQSITNSMDYHLKDASFRRETKTSCSLAYIYDCFQRLSIRHAGYPVMILILPLYKLVLYCVNWRLPILAKLLVGLFLILMKMVGYLCLEAVGHIKLGENATNITCLLESSESTYSVWNSLPLDYRWLIIPYITYSFGLFFVLTSAIQFVCAQSPYSMRGLLFGMLYSFMGISILVSYLVLLPLELTVHKWPPSRYGCGVWYLLSASIVLLLVFVVACFLSWKYKKRQRDELQHNEQMFAINYYERYILDYAVEN